MTCIGRKWGDRNTGEKGTEEPQPDPPGLGLIPLVSSSFSGFAST